ncbi:MAG: right-handed parallel beta-helix repeat-containing protein [Myxococcales bacterium]|nr:right-handed parallel beta-helix repeat-containing protein [Myxococcales bacterium]
MNRKRAWALSAGTLVLLALPAEPVLAATFYVSPTGSDTAAGTMDAPFASWGHAQSAVSPGDTVYFRGGTYRFTQATTTCGGDTGALVAAVVLSKSGAAGATINYFAFPGEKPVFDFSGITDTTSFNCRQIGVRVQASFLHLKGLELKGTLQLNNLNHESWCVYVIGGTNNLFEQLDAHHNMGPGFFVQRGGNNTFLNCDSHENEDTMTSNGDGQSADGFGCHPNQAGDTGNVFIGCRAWWNSDDGWDFINASAPCTVRYSWSWYNGYKPDAINSGAPVSLAAGNGNGFKGGGHGDPQMLPSGTVPQHTIEQNCAFFNKANGVYANHDIVNPFFYNNTSFNNGTDFNMLGLDGTTTTSVGFLRNNLAFSTDGHRLIADNTNAGPINDMWNSWDTGLGVTVSAADFQSLTFTPPASCPQAYTPAGTACCAPDDMTCFSGLASARSADGSLPVLPFLRLAATSALVDKGTDVGLPFSGAAPDLGCFEMGLVFDPSDGGATGAGGSGGGSGGGSSSSGGGSGGGGPPPGADAAAPRDGGRLDATGGAVSSSGGGGDAGSGSGGSPGGSGGAGGPSGASPSGSSGAGSSGANGGTASSGGAATGGGTAEDSGTAGEGAAPAQGCRCDVVGAGGVDPPAGILAGLGGALVAARRRRRRRG